MRTEKVIALLFLIGIVFRIVHWEGGGFFATIAALTMSMMYLAGGFYFFSNKNLRRQHLGVSILAGLLLSVAPLGILFKIQYWEGAGVMILTSVTVTILFLIIALVLRSQTEEELRRYYGNML
jgi:hypothetical protein